MSSDILEGHIHYTFIERQYRFPFRYNKVERRLEVCVCVCVCVCASVRVRVPVRVRVAAGERQHKGNEKKGTAVSTVPAEWQKSQTETSKMFLFFLVIQVFC